MSDLISRKAVIEAIHNYFRGLIDIDTYIFNFDVVDCAAEVTDVVEGVSVAYDVDKVVEQLTQELDHHTLMSNKNADIGLIEMARVWSSKADGIKDAINISKGAVKDE